jgi:hypothetical protein
MLKIGTPNLMFPLFPRARVDTGRPKFDFRSGCRGFLGLVPQPLFMKSKVCSEEQTGNPMLQIPAFGVNTSKGKRHPGRYYL